MRMTWVRLTGGFLAWAIAMDILDELVIPVLLGVFGHPFLGGLMVALDLDWLTYPLYFVVVGLWHHRRKP